MVSRTERRRKTKELEEDEWFNSGLTLIFIYIQGYYEISAEMDVTQCYLDLSA